MEKPKRKTIRIVAGGQLHLLKKQIKWTTET